MDRINPSSSTLRIITPPHQEETQSTHRNQNTTQDTISFRDGILPCISYSLHNLAAWAKYGLKKLNILHPPSDNIRNAELENTGISSEGDGQNLLKLKYYPPKLIEGLKNQHKGPSKRMGTLYGLFVLNYQLKLHEKPFVKEVVHDHIDAIGQEEDSLILSLAKKINAESLSLWIKSDAFNYEFLLSNIKDLFLSTIYSQFANPEEDKKVKLDLLEFLLCFVPLEGMIDDPFSIKNMICSFAEKNEDLFACLSHHIKQLQSAARRGSAHEKTIKDWLIEACSGEMKQQKLEILRKSIPQTIYFLTKEEFCINTRKEERPFDLVKKDIFLLIEYSYLGMQNRFPSAYLVEMFITFIEHNKVPFLQLAKCVLLKQQSEYCRWKELSKSLTDKIEDHPLHPERRAEKEDAKRCQLGKFWYGGSLSQYISSGRYDQMKEEAYGGILKEYINSNERNWEFLIDGISIWLLENFKPNNLKIGI